MKRWIVISWMLFVLPIFSPKHLNAAPDSRDSVIIESKTVNPGNGDPAAFVKVFITNKDSLKGFTLSLEEKSLTGGAYMSLGWPRNTTDTTGVVRWLTSKLNGYSILGGSRYNSSSPDTFMIACFYEGGNFANTEPPNPARKAFLEIRFDTVNSSLGTVQLDSALVVSGLTRVSTSFINMQAQEVSVNFVKGTITVAAPDVTPPSVAVTDPNGGESVPRPCPYTITWNASDNVGVTAVEVWLDRTNGGASYELQIANLTGNPGSYDWTPGGSTNSTNAKIKVIARDAAGNSSSDVSDNSFSIITYCLGRIIPGFDVNQDGISNVVDAVLVLNSLHKDSDAASLSLNKEYIESVLSAVFSNSP